ncbi:MAG: hypothetical protein IJK78_11850 [Bacteroidales bacterium]|nr:hypothetical protein [Bacteroidales bacterium]
MKIVFTIDGERKEVDVKRAMLHDASGNRYRVSEDIERGLEILAEDGKSYIEPHTSNEFTVFTKP